MMTMLAAVLLACLAALPTESATCNVQADCYLCTLTQSEETNGCVWCAATSTPGAAGRCQDASTRDGSKLACPSDMSALRVDRAHYATCPNNCPSYNQDCKTCVTPSSDNMHCSWCPSAPASSKCGLETGAGCVSYDFPGKCTSPSSGPAPPPDLSEFASPRSDANDDSSITAAGVVTALVLLVVVSLGCALLLALFCSAKRASSSLPTFLRAIVALPKKMPTDAELRLRQVSPLLLAIVSALCAAFLTIAAMTSTWSEARWWEATLSTVDQGAQSVHFTRSLWTIERCVDGSTCTSFDLKSSSVWGCDTNIANSNYGAIESTSSCSALNATRVCLILSLLPGVLGVALALLAIKDIMWSNFTIASKNVVMVAVVNHLIGAFLLTIAAGVYAEYSYPPNDGSGSFSFGIGYMFAWSAMGCHVVSMWSIATLAALSQAWGAPASDGKSFPFLGGVPAPMSSAMTANPSDLEAGERDGKKKRKEKRKKKKKKKKHGGGDGLFGDEEGGAAAPEAPPLDFPAAGGAAAPYDPVAAAAAAAAQVSAVAAQNQAAAPSTAPPLQG